jgi:DNA-binding CsgD family transcriptional regulator
MMPGGSDVSPPATERVIGRETEIAAIEALVAAPEPPAALVLEGPAGIGKTTVWQAGVASGQEQGHRVLVTRPLESDAVLSLAGLVDLLGELVDERGAELPEPQELALRTALLGEGAAGTAADPLALNAGALGLLRAAAAERPVLIAVDDVQWLDRPSADALRHAMRRLVDEDLRLMVARREGAHGATPLDLGLDAERIRRVALAPLGFEEIRELVAAELGRHLPLPVVRRIAELSGGNPFYTLELCHAIRRHGGDPAEPVVRGEALDRLVGERLAALPDATVNGLGTVAALARPSITAVAAALDDETALDAAFAAGVIAEDAGMLRFAHPLLAAAAYASLPPRRRRQVHARLAAIAHDPEERARHLAAATVGRDEEVAGALEEGAAAAEHRGAPAAAADLLERASALTLDEDHEAAGRRRVHAAWHHIRAGDKRRGTVLCEQLVASLPPGPSRAEALAMLATSGQAAMSNVVAYGRQGVEEAGDDPELRIRCLLAFANCQIAVNDWRGCYETAQEAVSLAREAASGDALAAALGMAGGFAAFLWPRGGRDLLDEAMDRGRDLLIPSAYDCPATQLGRAHLWADELDQARALLERVRRQAIEAGDEYGSAGVGIHLTEVEVRAGNLDRAREIADAGLVSEEQGQPDQELGFIIYGRALVAAHEGEVYRARELAARGLEMAAAVEDQAGPLDHHCVLGFLEVSLADPSAALSHLEPLPAEIERIGIGEPGVFTCHADLIEALIGAGRLEEAASRLEAWERLGHEIDRPRVLATAARACGLLAGAGGDSEGAVAGLEAALEHHERFPVPIERGRTLLALGSALRRSGQRRRARATLGEALELFTGIGARVWADRARAELGRLGGRAPAGDELTPTERRVAELVAAGSTNKEVAAALFVTVRTVEANLTRIYSKLGIRSRTELAARSRSAEEAAES